VLVTRARGTHKTKPTALPMRPLFFAAASAAVLAALALASPAEAGLFSSSRGSSSGFRSSSYRPSSSSSSYYSKPVSSGYGYKPSYRTTTPTFSAPKPGASAPFGSGGYASPSNFGNSFLGGKPGAASYGSSGSKLPTMPVKKPLGSGYGYRPSRPTNKMTSLAVPFAVGAGAGALTSAAFRSGQRSCGDGRLECFESACARARMQCPGAQSQNGGSGYTSSSYLRRVRCPPATGFAECWAAGGGQRVADGRLDDGDAPTFLCMGKARPRSSGDLVAQCFDYAGAADAKSSKRGAGAVEDDDGLTAADVLAGDPSLPTSRAMGYGAYGSGAGGVGGKVGGAARLVVGGMAAAAVLLMV
jgi:hypothetical protein